jgi:hypothetical protein
MKSDLKKGMQKDTGKGYGKILVRADGASALLCMRLNRAIKKHFAALHAWRHLPCF